jgi:hypothetical protein
MPTLLELETQFADMCKPLEALARLDEDARTRTKAALVNLLQPVVESAQRILSAHAYRVSAAFIPKPQPVLPLLASLDHDERMEEPEPSPPYPWSPNTYL